MIEGLSFPILVPIVLCLLATCMWLAMLSMFKPGAEVEYREGVIGINVKNARIIRIEQSKDRATLHLDREVDQRNVRLAA
jgi:hypothetical protein